MQSLKKFSPESIRAIARNANIDLQSIGTYSKSDIQHHIRTQQFQELLTQMDTIQRQSIDQNLRKLAETANLRKFTQTYAMFNFIGFLFSLLKGIYKTCAIHTQVNRQANVARILFAGFFGNFSSSINKILLDAQIKEYNTKIATRQNTYDEEHNNIEVTPTEPQLPPLPHNHPLSLVPRNFRT